MAAGRFVMVNFVITRIGGMHANVRDTLVGRIVDMFKILKTNCVCALHWECMDEESTVFKNLLNSRFYQYPTFVIKIFVL